MDGVNTAMADVSLDHTLDPSGDPSASAENLRLDAIARSNLQLISKKVKAVSLPDILTLYHDPASTSIPSVPADLQLPTLFAKWDEVAEVGGAAMEDGQDLNITRLSFYYDIDKYHNFTQYFEDTRLNILMIAYAWTAQFPARLCSEGVQESIQSYMDAWWETQVDEPDRGKAFPVPRALHRAVEALRTRAASVRVRAAKMAVPTVPGAQEQRAPERIRGSDAGTLLAPRSPRTASTRRALGTAVPG
jgi:hypothetical protein